MHASGSLRAEYSNPKTASPCLYASLKVSMSSHVPFKVSKDLTTVPSNRIFFKYLHILLHKQGGKVNSLFDSKLAYLKSNPTTTC